VPGATGPVKRFAHGSGPRATAIPERFRLEWKRSSRCFASNFISLGSLRDVESG
jgi:hypothetical protein